MNKKSTQIAYYQIDKLKIHFKKYEEIFERYVGYELHLQGSLKSTASRKHRKRSQKTNGFRPVSSRLVRKICVNLDIIQHDLSMKIKLAPASVRFSPPPIGWTLLVSNHRFKRLLH